ncbi:MAG: heavy metal translocating P-type ATPase [Gammaproteobacteria bacterium]|nr:heavy metal translocating P-type ATPase [Gammaproteobacteria bacterium]
MNAGACFHCALPVDRDDEYQVEIDGELQPVCCPGCKAVAELIRDTGMSSYYAMRETPQPGASRPADDAAEWTVFDRSDMLAAFADTDNGRAEATIYVGGMYCAACSWLIETTLAKIAGIASADVNPVTHRLRVHWHADKLGLGRILAALAELGYDPQPLAPESAARPEVAEQRMALKRLLVASLGMMQVMMFAVGLYAGDFQGMDADMQRFLRLVSFVVTTPVVFYSARPFFAGAWRGILSRMPGMDLPVSIAITAAYVGSVYSMMTGGPAVWFDSVVMFVFFLTLGRFLEMRARHRSIDRSTALSTILPNTVTRCEGAKQTIIPASQLVIGDRLLVRPGESIPADGVLLQGETTVDEALLTGEPEPRPKSINDELIAGSINLDGVIEMRVEKTGSDTTLGTISRLSERARYARPAFVQLADRIASYIVIAILAVAALVAAYWYVTAPERAFVITLSVLVVTCPCALALATPAAFAAAGTRLAELRLLVTNGNAIEALARASRILFDKTGTLTRGAPLIVATQIFDGKFSPSQCLDIAAALETVSTHPIAHAFAGTNTRIRATGQRVAIGNGVAGTIDGRRWHLGRLKFVAGNDSIADTGDHLTSVYLGTGGHVVARFDLDDEIRPDAKSTLSRLRDSGLGLTLLSGDTREPVQRVANELGIADYHFGCTPEDKLNIIRSAQQAGEIVVMVGDGINDAPVLAGADASIAPAHGALLAQTSADVILLGETLEPLATGVLLARQTSKIVKQNLSWAIVYNAAALPLAVMGFVPPWAAAIGMSASSLIVVLNALRLSRYGAP